MIQNQQEFTTVASTSTVEDKDDGLVKVIKFIEANLNPDNTTKGRGFYNFFSTMGEISPSKDLTNLLCNLFIDADAKSKSLTLAVLIFATEQLKLSTPNMPTDGDTTIIEDFRQYCIFSEKIFKACKSSMLDIPQVALFIGEFEKEKAQFKKAFKKEYYDLD